MIVWYYKLKRIFKPIIIVVIAALFVIVPLSFFFFEKREINDKEKLTPPTLSISLKEMNREIDSSSNIVTSDWTWTYNLSDFENYTCLDYYVIAKPMVFGDYYDYVDPLGNSTIWSYDHNNETNSELNRNWYSSMIYKSIFSNDEKYQEIHGNFLETNTSEWVNDSNIIRINDLKSSSRGYEIKAGAKIKTFDESGEEFIFNVYSDETTLNTNGNNNTTIISIPTIECLDVDEGTVDDIFIDSKYDDISTISVNANSYSLIFNASLYVEDGNNGNISNQLYSVKPNLDLKIYYDVNSDENDYEIGGSSAFNSEDVLLIEQENINLEFDSNGNQKFVSEFASVPSIAYDNHIMKETIKPENIKIDLHMDFKFNPLSEIRSNLNLDDDDVIVPEDGFDFSWIGDDLENPKSYSLDVNNMTSNSSSYVLEMVKYQLSSIPYTLFVYNNNVGTTEIRMITSDGFWFDNPDFEKSPISITLSFKIFQGAPSGGIRLTSWYSLTHFINVSYNENEYYTTSAILPWMILENEQYFIDQTSYIRINIVSNYDDGDLISDNLVSNIPDSNNRKIPFTNENFDFYHYSDFDQFEDALTPTDSTKTNFVMPENWFYNSLPNHEVNKAFLILIIVILIMLLLIPVLIVVFYNVFKKLDKKWVLKIKRDWMSKLKKDKKTVEKKEISK